MLIGQKLGTSLSGHLSDVFPSLADAQSLASGRPSAKVVLYVGQHLPCRQSNGGGQVDVVVDAADEVDVVDVAGACGRGESEDGLAHAHAWTVA